MAQNKLKIRVQLDGEQQVKSKLAMMQSQVRAFAVAAAASFAAFTVAATVALKGLGKAISQSFKFETMETQLEVLLGSAEAANKKFQELKEFSTSTPFELPGIVEAYQQLLAFTGAALSAKEGMILVGDAAAGRNKDFAEVAYWVGRLYNALKNKTPMIDSVSSLQRLGIAGGELRGELEAMVKDGTDFGVMWKRVEQDLLRFEGGLSKLSKTGEGLMSTLRDNWAADVAEFGKAFEVSAKDGIQLMIDKLTTLRQDGTIKAWAEGIVKALGDIKTVGATTWDWLMSKPGTKFADVAAQNAWRMGSQKKDDWKEEIRKDDRATINAADLSYMYKTGRLTAKKYMEEMKKLGLGTLGGKPVGGPDIPILDENGVITGFQSQLNSSGFAKGFKSGSRGSSFGKFGGGLNKSSFGKVGGAKDLTPISERAMSIGDVYEQMYGQDIKGKKELGAKGNPIHVKPEDPQDFQGGVG